MPIEIPPLRERPEDVVELAAHFVKRSARRHGRSIAGIDPEALCALAGYRWPGNIRELENAIERAVLLCESERLRVPDLPAEVVSATPQPPDGSDRPSTLRERIRSATRRIERDAIEEALRETGGNITQAAHALGLSRRGLQLKLRELGIR